MALEIVDLVRLARERHAGLAQEAAAPIPQQWRGVHPDTHGWLTVCDYTHLALSAAKDLMGSMSIDDSRIIIVNAIINHLETVQAQLQVRDGGVQL